MSSKIPSLTELFTEASEMNHQVIVTQDEMEALTELLKSSGGAAVFKKHQIDPQKLLKRLEDAPIGQSGPPDGDEEAYWDE